MRNFVVLLSQEFFRATPPCVRLVVILRLTTRPYVCCSVQGVEVHTTPSSNYFSEVSSVKIYWHSTYSLRTACVDVAVTLSSFLGFYSRLITSTWRVRMYLPARLLLAHLCFQINFQKNLAWCWNTARMRRGYLPDLYVQQTTKIGQNCKPSLKLIWNESMKVFISLATEENYLMNWSMTQSLSHLKIVTLHMGHQ